MAGLTVCPMHLSGIFGLLLLFFALYHQVTLAGASDFTIKKEPTLTAHKSKLVVVTNRTAHMDVSLFNQILFYIFGMALLYTTTFLPAGRYYQRVGGNFGMLFSYFYIMCYLVFYNLKSTFRKFLLYKVYKLGGYHFLTHNHIACHEYRPK